MELSSSQNSTLYPPASHPAGLPADHLGQNGSHNQALTTRETEEVSGLSISIVVAVSARKKGKEDGRVLRVFFIFMFSYYFAVPVWLGFYQPKFLCLVI